MTLRNNGLRLNNVIASATAAYASNDHWLELKNGSNGTGTLVTANNGNTWLNADGGKDLWLNWVSLNNKTSKADLQVGDGNYGRLFLQFKHLLDA